MNTVCPVKNIIKTQTSFINIILNKKNYFIKEFVIKN